MLIKLPKRIRREVENFCINENLAMWISFLWTFLQIVFFVANISSLYHSILNQVIRIIQKISYKQVYTVVRKLKFHWIAFSSFLTIFTRNAMSLLLLGAIDVLRLITCSHLNIFRSIESLNFDLGLFRSEHFYVWFCLF